MQYKTIVKDGVPLMRLLFIIGQVFLGPQVRYDFVEGD
jgi:hypothetical protein